MRTGHTPARGEATYWADCSIPWFTLADVWQIRHGKQKFLGETAENISTLGLKNSAAELLPAGTVVLSRTASVGFTGIMPVPMATSQDFWNWVCGPQLSPDFLYWQLSAMGDTFRQLTNGSTHKTIYQGDAASLRICVPPLETQKRIAAFLDEKTAQIDALIAKKQSLLERLAEKRQAIITQAVTKGLNPAAPMKDSGIEWLGQVPLHWELKRLRFLLEGDTRNGLYKPKDQFDDDGVPFVQMGEAFRDLCFSGGTKDRVVSSQSELSRWGLRSGDFLIARRSIVFDGSGKSVLIGDLEELHLFESSMIRIRLIDPKFSEYLSYYFQSLPCRAFFLSVTKQVTISGIDSQQLKDIWILIPSKSETDEIAIHIKDAEDRLSTLLELARKSIAELVTYRSALITAAVTGQIEGLQ